MINTRMKIGLVCAGVFWCSLLIYFMSSLGEEDQNGSLRARGDAMLESSKKAIAYHAAKSKSILESVLKKVKGDGGVVPAPKGPDSPFEDLPALPPPHVGGNSSLDNASPLQVIISGDATSLLGVAAAMNSVLSNTRHPVHFYITLQAGVLSHFKNWLMESKLKTAQFTLRPHPTTIPDDKPHYAKLYLNSIFPDLKGHVLYLDNDVIVQGDISELTKLRSSAGMLGFFPQDCSSVSKRIGLETPVYMSHINFDHPNVKAAKLSPNACSFDTDVFTVDLKSWKEANVSAQFQAWLLAGAKAPLHGTTLDGDDAEAAMLLTLYKKTEPLPQLWHVSKLGVAKQGKFSAGFIQSAKLLHWSGHFKPWGSKASFQSVWDTYYVPDPLGKYKPAFRRG